MTKMIHRLWIFFPVMAVPSCSALERFCYKKEKLQPHSLIFQVLCTQTVTVVRRTSALDIWIAKNTTLLEKCSLSLFRHMKLMDTFDLNLTILQLPTNRIGIECTTISHGHWENKLMNICGDFRCKQYIS